MTDSTEKTPPEATHSDEPTPAPVTTPDTGPEAAQAGDGDNPDAGDDQDDGTDADDTTKANREAAKWRRKLRDTEAERDALSARLEHLQRTEAQRIAAAHLADGGDIWRDGAELARVLDDAGNVDAARVAEVAAEVATAHPHYGRRAPTANLKRGGLASGATGVDQLTVPSWQRVLRGNAD